MSVTSTTVKTLGRAFAFYASARLWLMLFVNLRRTK
jgi:hypothetical protein